MDPPGAQDERGLQQERLRREEAYYHFINSLTEEEYRLMRDSNLLGTPGEVTAEELRQRLDGAKERLSVQPHPPSSEVGVEDGSSGAAGEASHGDSLLEWLNTFRRTGNATRSGQSGNQTWRAVSRTNPNSGEFRFSLEININHEQPEPADLPGPTQALPSPTQAQPGPARLSHYPPARHALTPSARLVQSRRQQARRGRGSPAPFLAIPEASGLPEPVTTHTAPAPPSFTPLGQGGINTANAVGEREPPPALECPRVSAHPLPPEAPPLPQEVMPTHEPRSSRTRARGRGRRTRAGSLAGGHRRGSQRSRSPLHRGHTQEQPQAAAMETEEPATSEMADATPDEVESQAPSAGGATRRHPTIMLDLQVRRIRPGESRDRDSVASRTRSRLRMAENTVTFESDSGGFRRTISRSERAGVRTYVSTIRIPLRRISETGLGEPSSAALRSILRQIMTGFGELSSLMETEADAEAGGPPPQALRDGGGPGPREPAEGRGNNGAGPMEEEEERRRTGGAPGRDTNNLVENGTLPILRLAHFFLLNDEEDEEHPRGLTKEQIDNLSTRTYGQAGLEADVGRACSVCISEYAQGNKLRRLPCAHEFHVHCIDRWLSENNTCPICRQPVLHAHRG
ncbi:E3 ubiquitin-protein ligase RNF6 [Brienomyrus brachyistius]|uniref:E3 ubiquitin-protein ligase RNF6 n=1 Tax=Brienomyrus brachyistius TaxID=42636 RepID=UPI0020B1A3B9|nr:E3 ubiquitin-protein ligase RNF6 [Brienomyrus brachyistius]